MNTIFVHRDGRTEQVTSIDRSWLGPASGAYLWIDLASPSIPESLVLTDTFAFHRLSVDDALATAQMPKIEAYDGYLFASMCGGDADIAFFVGSHYVVSVHWHDSKAIADLTDSVRHGGKAFVDGPVAIFHKLADAATGGLTAVIERLAACVTALEKRLLEKANAGVVADVLGARRDVFALTQRLTRERDALDRLVRREIVDISAEMAFRFRDVRDRVMRLLDEALALDHRLSGLLTAAAGAAGGRRWM
jgi:magnesium transporter